MNICKELREAMGLTISGCAKEMGTAVSTLKFYENGGTVTDKTVKKIADFFGVSVAQLKGNEGIDIAAWKQKKAPAKAEAQNIQFDPEQHPKLPMLGIKQIVKTSNAAVNHYLKAGWILLDTMPMKEDEGFFCLIGNAVVWTPADFERIKTPKKESPFKSYWMGSEDDR